MEAFIKERKENKTILSNQYLLKALPWQAPEKKSHTCEEGGAHFRISVWHLLMKNKSLLKKLLKWANKKQNNFNIYNVAFFKKI